MKLKTAENVDNFVSYIEKNNFSVRIEKMRCVDVNMDTVLGNINGKYYDVWVVVGQDVNCSGRKGEPLANVINRWARVVKEFKDAR